MALKIRLRQQGRTNRQSYRLVVTDIRNPRDGKYLEAIGFYDPLKAEDPFSLNAERLTHWLSLGAELSPNARRWVGKVAPTVMESILSKESASRSKLVAERKERRRRKAALAKKTS